jgi:hypothetical protein
MSVTNPTGPFRLPLGPSGPTGPPSGYARPTGAYEYVNPGPAPAGSGWLKPVLIFEILRRVVTGGW